MRITSPSIRADLRRRSGVDRLTDALDLNLVFTLSGLGNVVKSLMRMSVSIFTPNAFSMRRALSPERSDFEFSKLDKNKVDRLIAKRPAGKPEIVDATLRLSKKLPRSPDGDERRSKEQDQPDEYDPDDYPDHDDYDNVVFKVD